MPPKHADSLRARLGGSEYDRSRWSRLCLWDGIGGGGRGGAGVQYHVRLTGYDEVLYINSPYAQTHPSRRFVMGRWAGLNPPAVETCWVLEIGASEGENLIGMAMALPSAEFRGIELAAVPVARGQKTISALGLRNVRLQQMNLLEVNGEARRVRLHCYPRIATSWTPPAVRDKILAIARRHLSAHGIAFVSYNAQPGGHIRNMMREMMLYHIGDEENPVRRLEKARDLLRLIAMGRPESDPLESAVAAHAVDTLERKDSSLFHDDLSDCYEPVYFHEFAKHAAQHQLQYLGEANLRDSLPSNLAADAIEKARAMAAGDRIAEQQYLDFARTRRFRQSLICHAGNVFERGETPRDATRRARLRKRRRECSSIRPEREDDDESPGSGEISAAADGFVAALRIGSKEDAGLALELYRVGMIELHGFSGVARKAGSVRMRASLRGIRRGGAIRT